MGSTVLGVGARDRDKDTSETTWRDRAANWGGAIRHRAVALVRDRRFQVATIVTTTLLVGSFAYCWLQASRMIDAHLDGAHIDTRSGLYSAPLTVRPGQPLAQEDLVAYLQQLGYGSEDEGERESGFTGRFAVDGDAVAVEPLDANVRSAGIYRPVRIEFSGERGVRRIMDLGTEKRLDECKIQPLLISANYSAKEKRIPIEYAAIPDVLRKAIVVTEDRRYWDHNGVDYAGIARAVRENLDEGEIVQGGSTITQQVIKNLMLTPERTYSRKIREAFLSYVLEARLTKEEIFALYCNEIYLGQSGTYAVHGVAEATHRFFGKDLSAITLDEAALLAGLIRAPSTNSPYRHPENAKARRDLVLDMMVEAGAITPDEARAAKARPVQVVPPTQNSEWLDAPYFNDYVKDYLEEVYGDSRYALGRVRVETTIDINLQRAATRAIDEHLERLDKVLAKGRKGVEPGTVQVALVAIDPHSGAVLAMVGGRDYSKSQLNRATDAMRQPGSVFKPFVYATAFSQGRFTPATMVLDAPQKFRYDRNKVYEPSNYGESYRNEEISVREAFVHSKNVPTVEVALRTGLGNIAAMAERAGLPRPDPYPAMALGTFEATPLQVAEAYTTFANGGDAVEPSPVAATGQSGSISVRRAKARMVLTSSIAYMMTDLMQDVVNRGTGAGVRARGLKGAVAGKTGTSRDGWFAGYTPNLVCVVWVGFDDNSQLGMTGSEAALPIWTEFMKQAVAFRPDLAGDRFPRPSGIFEVEICADSGQLALPSCPNVRKEKFFIGSEPVSGCSMHSGLVEGLEPMFDEDGNFIGYAPPEIGTLELTPEEIEDATNAAPGLPDSVEPPVMEEPEEAPTIRENERRVMQDAGEARRERGARPSSDEALPPPPAQPRLQSPEVPRRDDGSRRQGRERRERFQDDEPR